MIFAGPARHVGRIAAKEFNDRLRSGWVLACVVLWLGAVGLTSFFGLAQVGRIGIQGYERTVASLLNLVQYFVPLLALLLGHDLIVSEREDRTLGLILASGVSRVRLVLGKWIGGCLTLSVPLALGFVIAGAGIGLAARDTAVVPFLLLASSGLSLGLVFLSAGLAISTLCRTRVQALALALLTWCIAVFVFDLVALSVVLSAKAPVVAQEIELVCDATHVNAAADLHSAYDISAPAPTEAPRQATRPSLTVFLLANPIDLFRAVNLSMQTSAAVPIWGAVSACVAWLAALLGASIWRFRSLDL